MVIYGENVLETIDTRRLLNDYILDRSVAEQRSREMQSNYYLEYISMAYVSTGSVSRVAIWLWRSVMFTFLALVVKESFNGSGESCTAFRVMYMCAVWIAYSMLGSVALNMAI